MVYLFLFVLTPLYDLLRLEHNIIKGDQSRPLIPEVYHQTCKNSMTFNY